MRLLVCTYEYFPYGSGVANVTHAVVEALRKKGIEVTVCAPEGGDINLGGSSLISTAGLVGLVGFWNRVAKLDLGSYDAVWLNQPMLTNKISHPNLTVTVHMTYKNYSENHYSPHPYYKAAAMLEKKVLNSFDESVKFTCINKQIKGELEEIGIPLDRIRVIPNGVDTEKFKRIFEKANARMMFGLPEKKKIILYLGRLTEQKMPLKMIKLFSELEKIDDSVFLAVAGKGELLEKTKQEAEKLGVQNIKFMGYIPEDHVVQLYLCSDWFILLSRYEALSLSLLDALAAGLPCIVTDIEGLRPVKDYACGIAIPVQDFESDMMIQEDAQMLSDGVLRDLYHLYSKASKKAAKKFDWKIISELYLKRLAEDE